MKRPLLIILLLFQEILSYSQTSALKAVIYDFDGLDIGQTDLPDGDYSNSDLTYKIVQTPLVTSDVLGDRVLEADLNWSVGFGEFGKQLGRFIELNAASDRLNFYLYNPVTNGADSILQATITEDDNSNGVFEYGADDKWVDTIIIQRLPGWQLISLPLNSFKDQNAGGNGIFDVGYSGPGSMLFSVSLAFIHTDFSASSEQYFIDMLSFSEGALPSGATILDLPEKDPADHCILGALANNIVPDATPDTINNLFSAPKLRYVNWFIDYSSGGTTANAFPGTEVQHLLDGGYTPVITWEMMYGGYSRLDPVQPRLDKILNGSFDAYIDQFADKIRSYNKTIILRIFHEFEGDWYPWSLTQNGDAPDNYISAWHHVVDRFRARGTYNVQWMWCVNAEPKPYVDYNSITNAYPGDGYVDIVAVDIYNHPDLGVPDWKSFRLTVAETYYCLTKNFPEKPFYICEIACRERYASESLSSQTKAEWICQMNSDLQSYFSKTRALIFFSLIKEHDWRLDSSPAALNSVTSCVWSSIFFDTVKVDVAPLALNPFSVKVYPNPFISNITVDIYNLSFSDPVCKMTLYDLYGKKIKACDMNMHETFGQDLAAGVYVIEISSGTNLKKIKVIKIKEDS